MKRAGEQRLQSRLAFIIPTMNRPTELRRLLASMESQSALPDEIIIVDGSTEPVESIAREFPGLKLKYVRVFPRGLVKQRNIGVSALSFHITVAGYLDDDIVVEPGSSRAGWVRRFSMSSRPCRMPSAASARAAMSSRCCRTRRLARRLLPFR